MGGAASGLVDNATAVGIHEGYSLANVDHVKVTANTGLASLSNQK